MKIKLASVQFLNYMKHRDLSVQFHESFNVIAGRNGSGKTSLLRALSDAILGFTPSIHGASSQGWMGKRDIAHEVSVTHGGSVRFEPMYPIIVSASAHVDDSLIEWSVQKASAVDIPMLIGLRPNRLLKKNNTVKTDNLVSDTLPLMLFYQADRNWPAVTANVMQAATQKVSREDAYINWLSASSDNVTLQTWIISKTLERLQAAQDAAVSSGQVADELSLVVKAIVAALPECSDIRYDMVKKSIIVKWAMDGEVQSVPFEQLSDGQRTIMGLIADIARRMVVLNPHLGSNVCIETPGIILIDELDIHLHPKWQRQIVRGLKDAFPNIQFIAASHSPQILGELTPDEIILLRPGGTAHPEVSYGLTSSQVLEEIMDASARTPEVESLLAEVFEFLERGELQSAKKTMATLKATAPGIPELTGAEALLRRKEVLGR